MTPHKKNGIKNHDDFLLFHDDYDGFDDLQV